MIFMILSYKKLIKNLNFQFSEVNFFVEIKILRHFYQKLSENLKFLCSSWYFLIYLMTSKYQP